MYNRLHGLGILTLMVLMGFGSSQAMADPALIPADSALGQTDDGAIHMLLTPLANPSGIATAGWRMDQLAVGLDRQVQPKLGEAAVRLSGRAQPGGKGDFTVTGRVPGQATHLGLWVHLAQDANVSRVGLQFHDAEGEAFLLTRPADWTGWQWVEFDLTANDPPQAYKQEDKNQRLDHPIRNVNVAWFARDAGPSRLTVNALVAAVRDVPANATPALSLAAVPEVEPGTALQLPLIVPNPTDRPVQARVTYQLQRDANLTPVFLPDARHGSDVARGLNSWTEVNGQRIGDDNTLTDGNEHNGTTLPWSGGYTEAFQYIELDQPRRITHLSYRSGDANWVWKLDLAASMDGRTWQDVPDLTGLDIHKKWGAQHIRVPEPFTARHLRLRYHRDGESANKFALPARFSVFDGLENETWDMPQVGPTLLSSESSVSIAPRSFGVVTIGEGQPLPSGAYLLAVRVESDHATQLLAERMFALPEPMTVEQRRVARIGLNSSNHTLAASHRELGIGWVRFENLKWRMTSPRPNYYRFDGLPPWSVHHDQWLKAMAEEDIQVSPYLFQCPEWASSAPADVGHRAHYPPRDNADYGDFVFQTVARYGNRKHDPSVLKTDDKLSGLGLLSVYEMWNEPNLNDPNWGNWVGTLPQYYEMFRVGAEAARRADPTAKVTNGGFAGITLGLVDQLRSYEYADGKHPLDFMDILNVHTYTGAVAPERSVVDTNVDRSGNTEGSVSHEEHLRRLGDWRDLHRPDMPIWLTETGYDTGGPRRVTEREQAAYQVRNCLMMFAGGVDMIFIFREVGSGDSLYAASGLLRSGDHSKKPSWFTVATLLRQMDGADPKVMRLPHDNPEVYLFAWQRQGQWVMAAYTIDSQPTPLALPLGSATVTDAFGGVEQIADASQLMLTDMPVYLGAMENTGLMASLWQQAETAHEQWRQNRRRAAQLDAYLYDFGSLEHVGATDVGRPRPFTPVLAEDVYDADRGFGFTEPAESNHDVHYIRSVTQRDSCRVRSGAVFRADLKSGNYEVKIGFNPQGARGQVEVTSGQGNTRTLDFIRRQQQEVTTAFTIEGDRLELRFLHPGYITFLTVIEQP